MEDIEKCLSRKDKDFSCLKSQNDTAYEQFIVSFIFISYYLSFWTVWTCPFSDESLWHPITTTRYTTVPCYMDRLEDVLRSCPRHPPVPNLHGTQGVCPTPLEMCALDTVVIS